MAVYEVPILNEVESSRQMVSQFGGYNHNLRIGDGEFYDMQNMSSDLYPALSPRLPRGKVRQLTKPNGLFSHNALAWVDGTEFWYAGSRVDGFTLTDSKKTFAAIGAYIVIFPDKKYFNTEDQTFGNLGETVNLSSVTVAPCRLDGAEITPTVSSTAPADPADGDMWVDTGSTPHVLKQYSAVNGVWSSVPTTYAKITGTGLGVFSEYDAVTISGMSVESLNGSFILYRVGTDYVVVAVMVDAAASLSGEISVVREVPDMDYVTQNENRLWGCNSVKHEIYASALGDPTNWNQFMGLSTDSYALTVGSPGDFTGAITHLGYVLFFKEDVIHKIYGSKPANYQLTNVNCRGVEKGSEKSLQIVNETLYYKSRQDVCTFSGALPSSISQVLGGTKYKNAAAGHTGSKYYISMEEQTGAAHLFVFDEARGLWHREDGVKAEYFASLGDELYFIDESDKCLYAVSGALDETYTDNNAAAESKVKSFAVTGDIGLDSPDNKYVSKIQLRVVVDADSLLEIYVQYDRSNRWECKYRMRPTGKRTFVVPIIPRRCDTMRIKIVGEGRYWIYSLTKKIEQGSEM